MNRQDRRRAARKGAHGHLDCGCTPRLMKPVELVTEHECGHRLHHQVVVMPTGAPVGSLKTMQVLCACEVEVDVAYLVCAL